MHELGTGIAIGVVVGLSIAIPAIARANRRFKHYSSEKSERARSEIWQDGYDRGLQDHKEGVVSMSGSKR